MKKLNKTRVLKWLLSESIKKVISEEMAFGSLRMRDLEITNKTFVNRVLKEFLKSTLPYFSFIEIEEFLNQEL